MANQFIHLNSYGFKVSARRRKECRTITGVLGEMMRTPSYSRHVAEPRPPTVVYGEDPADVVLRRARAAFQQVRDARGRRLRVDALVAIVGVASWPVPLATTERDPRERARFRAWERDNLAWLRERFGTALRTVVRHDDEMFPHVHFAVIPEDLTTVLDHHPGHAARRAATEADLRAPIPNIEYKRAMQDMQDDYHRFVGGPHDCARISDAPRQRYSRTAYVEKLRTGAWKPGVGPVSPGKASSRDMGEEAHAFMR